MKELLLEEHLGNIRELAARSKTLTSGILIFAITLSVTVLAEWIESRRLEDQRAALTLDLTPSFEDLNRFYERTHGLLGDYVSKEATPWSQLCFFLKEEYGNLSGAAGVREVPKTEKVKSSLAGVCQELGNYSNSLRNIAYHQSLGASFESLPKEVLHSLNFVIHHDMDNERFSQALDTMRDASTYLLRVGQSSSSAVLPPRARVLAEHGSSQQFESLVAHFFLRDLREGATGVSLAVRLEKARLQIDSLPLGSVLAVRNRSKELEDKMAAIQSGASVPLPVLGIQVPHSVFWIAGAVVNSMLLLGLLYAHQAARRSLCAHRNISAAEGGEFYELLAERFSIRAGRSLPANAWTTLVLLSPTVVSIAVLFGNDEGISPRAALDVAVLAFNILLLIRIFAEARQLLIEPLVQAD